MWLTAKHWSDILLICLEIKCKFDEGQFANGHVVRETGSGSKRRGGRSRGRGSASRAGRVHYFKTGAEVRLKCDDPEAEMEGASVLTCQDDGIWNAQVPTCHQLPCSKIPKYENWNCHVKLLPYFSSVSSHDRNIVNGLRWMRDRHVSCAQINRKYVQGTVGWFFSA